MSTSCVRLGLFGYGKMGEAFADILKEKCEVYVYDIVEERLKVAESRGLKVSRSAREIAELCDIWFISVRPQDVEDLAREIGSLASGRLVISIVAGLETSRLESYFPGSRVVRLMPNINVRVRHAVIALCPGKTASRDDVELVKKLLEGGGIVIEIPEKLMPAYTMIGGVTPALAAYFADALAWSGVLLGLDSSTSLKIVAHILIGTGKHLLEKKPDEIIEMVATPGGVTIESIEYLEKEGVKGKIMESIKQGLEKERRLKG